jgi:hypothetical protein
MTRTVSLRWLLAIALLFALLASGCSRKLASDPGITMPEGVFSPDAQLVMSSDTGNPVNVFHGTGGGGVAFDSTYQVYLRTPGITLGMLMDGTASSEFEMMRRQSSGSYADIKDFMLTPLDRWLPGQWAAYLFFDGSSSSYSPPTYLGRGKIAGVVTPNSPLTNEAVLMSAPVGTVTYTGAQFPPDTLVTMSWNRVPGAVRYWMQIFTFRNDVRDIDELFPIGTRTPIAVGKVKNYFVGYIDAPATSYKLGDPGARVFTSTPLLHNNPYRVRIAAVSDDGRLLAITDGVPQVSQRDNNFYVYSLRAELISL